MPNSSVPASGSIASCFANIVIISYKQIFYGKNDTRTIQSGNRTAATHLTRLYGPYSPVGGGEYGGCGCKLLSKLYLCTTEYSLAHHYLKAVFVVNCFQNCIFVLPNTAKPPHRYATTRCKLLSKLYLCSTEYSCYAAG